MMFLFQNVIANAVKKKFDIDINNPEYKRTVFSVDSVETEDPDKEPFDKTYKGDIMIFKNDKPIYALSYIIKSQENIPEQSSCYIFKDEKTQDSLNDIKN